MKSEDLATVATDTPDFNSVSTDTQCTSIYIPRPNNEIPGSSKECMVTAPSEAVAEAEQADKR